MVDRQTTQAPRDGSNLPSVMRSYMRTRGLRTQTELAHVLGVERSLVAKYLNGSRRCHDVVQLRQFAEAMDLPPDTFGVLPNPPVDSAEETDPTAEEAARWRLVRQTLNRQRARLTRLAAGLYWDAEHVAGTACISPSGWIPAQPIPLEAVHLTWDDSAPQPTIVGYETESAPCRPLTPSGQRYAKYCTAIRVISAPKLFENRGSYRLLKHSTDADSVRMTYGYTTYFDMVNVCEMLGHELAEWWLNQRDEGAKPQLENLPYRALVGDLFELHQRPVLPSINTLTIRRSSAGDTFFLHRRGASHVAVAAGLSHVIPAGVFQPSGIAPWNMAGDFALWRNILREYSEEFLGNAEHDGSNSAPIGYDTEEPFAMLNEGRRAGKVRAWYLGTGMDPLVPAGEILTAVTIDADVFDSAFGDLVKTNAEGDLVPSDPEKVGISWDARSIQRVRNQEPVACAADACIALTWKHRAAILSK